MNYDEWEAAVPEVVRGDSLWKMTAYRLALFLSDLGWRDATRLIRDRRTLSLSDQLYRALGSISANLAEGCSRGTGRDRAHFYEYALGSTRESRDCYYKGRFILDEGVVQHRRQLPSEIARLLLTMIPEQRRHAIREQGDTYQSNADEATLPVTATDQHLEDLLHNVPLPDS